MSKNNFQKIYEIDVNHKTKEKSGLKYLSWAWAWAEFKKVDRLDAVILIYNLTLCKY